MRKGRLYPASAAMEAPKAFGAADHGIMVTSVYPDAGHGARMNVMSESGAPTDIGYFGGQFYDCAFNGSFSNMTPPAGGCAMGGIKG